MRNLNLGEPEFRKILGRFLPEKPVLGVTFGDTSQRIPQ